MEDETITEGKDTPRPTRRAMLAGVAGGLAALGATAIAKAPVAFAGVDGDVVLGAGNNAATATGITNTSTGSALLLTATSANPTVSATNLGTGIALQGDVQDVAGIGIQAINEADGGTALQVIGKATFTTRSGVATVAANTSSVKVSNILGIDASSVVLAVLRQHRAGVHVEAVVPVGSSNSFTIYLNQNVTTSTKVGWFIVN